MHTKNLTNWKWQILIYSFNDHWNLAVQMTWWKSAVTWSAFDSLGVNFWKKNTISSSSSALSSSSSVIITIKYLLIFCIVLLSVQLGGCLSTYQNHYYSQYQPITKKPTFLVEQKYNAYATSHHQRYHGIKHREMSFGTVSTNHERKRSQQYPSPMSLFGNFGSGGDTNRDDGKNNVSHNRWSKLSRLESSYESNTMEGTSEKSSSIQKQQSPNWRTEIESKNRNYQMASQVGLISPQQILTRLNFLPPNGDIDASDEGYHVDYDHDINSFCDDSRHCMSSLRPRSLSVALELMREALEHIKCHDDEIASAALEKMLDEKSMRWKGMKALRIEIPISSTSTVDPLAWLHSQEESLLRRKQQGQSCRSYRKYEPRNVATETTPSMFYMNVHESSMEVAAIGTAIGWNTTNQLWDDMPHIVPHRSLVYGGHRFDHKSTAVASWNKNGTITTSPKTTDYDKHDLPTSASLPKRNTDIGKEWKVFGEAFWKLPTVELLRRQQQQAQPLLEETITDEVSIEEVVLAVHIVCSRGSSWSDAAHETLHNVLDYISSKQSARVPPTTLPPILSRNSRSSSDSITGITSDTKKGNSGSSTSTSIDNSVTSPDGQELYEAAFEAAIHEFNASTLEKVVLARQQTLQFDTSFKSSSLDIIRRWKYGGHEGGHLFWLKPPGTTTPTALDSSGDLSLPSIEFFGCTPERLFQIRSSQTKKKKHSSTKATTVVKTVVRSEALAGSRPRGSTQLEDEMLLQELWNSPKDRRENALTAAHIHTAFDELLHLNLIKLPQATTKSGSVKNYSISSNANALISTDFGVSEKTMDDTNPVSTSLYRHENELQHKNIWSQGFFVRRLLHLQHLCQSFIAELISDDDISSSSSSSSKPNIQSVGTKAMQAAQYLLSRLHPTPAVCGVPASRALQFIEQHESIGFDRGYYGGPVGYIGRNEADVLVAIRSGLAITSQKVQLLPVLADSGKHRQEQQQKLQRRLPSTGESTVLSLYAGGGIVSGSRLREEWAETNYKFAVIASLFPQSPVTLRSQTTPNVAWATAFIEELIRNGITRFYVCPGSRSTPLVVALAHAVRTHSFGGAGGGIIRAISVLDERSAGFRCVGYARGNGRPAAVITSSGTAVANLYPAIVEAGVDGIPMLVLTADRPYESRDSGANQAIDQVKIFSSTYVRWFRDILPPSDDVPVSVALSDACHAVAMTRRLRGPVHVNIQFRENLAPDSGKIRNDNRVDSITKYNGLRFTDVPGFHQWSRSGDIWCQSYANTGLPSTPSSAALDVTQLIRKSSRGIIVVGNLRIPTDTTAHVDQSTISQAIADFAELIGFPIFAGVQSGNLRFISSAVVPFAEHLLKCPVVRDNLNPDLILQIGTPLVSTGIVDVLSSVMKLKDIRSDDDESSMDVTHMPYHVLIHPHIEQERSDPSFTVTHKISSEIIPFLDELSQNIKTWSSNDESQCSSQLAPIISLGRKLQYEMKSIITEATRNVLKNQNIHLQQSSNLTEPDVIVALSEIFERNQENQELSLFLSNSMPVRDGEFFLYPYSSSFDLELFDKSNANKSCLKSVGANRGASGIDGIISTALGYAESTHSPTTLLIGDVATIHDIGSFHSVVKSALNPTKKRQPLITVIVNNDGGGIFSFLPIAAHGNDVAFEEFFGTSTSSFSFVDGAKAFGLTAERVTNAVSFREKFEEIVHSKKDYVLEAVVTSREVNVEVHKEITKSIQVFVEQQTSLQSMNEEPLERLPIKIFKPILGSNNKPLNTQKRVAVLLHGWMADKSEWDTVAEYLMKRIGPEWTVVAIDLPGHGGAALRKSNDAYVFRNALNLINSYQDEKDFVDIDTMAETVLSTLAIHNQIRKIDAIVGYSLGGRVALAMNSRCSQSSQDTPNLIDSATAIVLLSSYPGELANNADDLDNSPFQNNEIKQIIKADKLAHTIHSICDRSCIDSPLSSNVQLWESFLVSWYRNPMWGTLNRKGKIYTDLIQRRSNSLSRRGRDLAAVVSHCTPPRNRNDSWRYCIPARTLFVAASLDTRYARIGKDLQKTLSWQVKEINGVGHALLVESPEKVADLITDFTSSNCSLRGTYIDLKDTNTSKWDDNKKVPTTTAVHEFRQVNNELLLVDNGITIGALELKSFSIPLRDKDRDEEEIYGIGWGHNARANDSTSKRQGFVFELDAANGVEVGIGEVSPLSGIHTESLEDVRGQLLQLKYCLETSNNRGRPVVQPRQILALKGSLEDTLRELEQFAEISRFLPSVRSGLEMALLSLSSQKIGLPIHQAIGQHILEGRKLPASKPFAVSGLITRVSASRRSSVKASVGDRKFPSVKVKVGHQHTREDAISMLRGFQGTQLYHGGSAGYVRADANRAWNESQAIEFSSALEGVDLHALDRIEFIEEPLKKCFGEDGLWSLAAQVDALERTFFHTGIPYALDESIADTVAIHGSDFALIENELENVFRTGSRGCAAFVLKPALLGLELSSQISTLAKTKLQIGVVFSSCFDSGLGLAYTSFLGHVANQLPSSTVLYPHGVGTFTMLGVDTINPTFESFVNEYGILNIPALSRALYGLSLDEMRDLVVEPEPSIVRRRNHKSKTMSETYEASTATSRNGKEISVVVNLHLPFSAETACIRFADLPSMSRWSPWISSVQYQGTETEWTIYVKGIPLKWRAESRIVSDPHPGIVWQSVSGLSNSGIVEFVPITSSSCNMSVRMTIVTPRLLKPLFQGTSIFVEEFLRDKLLKWSLEMFRDVVKADLAIERGDVELGDALIGAVEGKSNAIEATLNSTLN